jgi:hypothetical protein
LTPECLFWHWNISEEPQLAVGLYSEVVSAVLQCSERPFSTPNNNGWLEHSSRDGNYNNIRTYTSSKPINSNDIFVLALIAFIGCSWLICLRSRR